MSVMVLLRQDAASSGGVLVMLQRQRSAAQRDRRLQFEKLGFQIFVGHDQRLDGAAQIAVAHRDRLVAGLLIMAVVERLRWGRHGERSGSVRIRRSECSYFVLTESSFPTPGSHEICSRAILRAEGKHG